MGFLIVSALLPRVRAHMRSLLKITIGRRVINLVAGSTKTTFPGKTSLLGG